MTTLYVTEPRALVRKDGDTLTVQIPEDKQKGTDKRTVRVPLIKVDQVVVLGDATITSPALAALLENHVEVCYLSMYGKFRGRLSPAFSKNALIRIEQHRAYNDPARALDLARRFVSGKLSNMRTLLLRANRKLALPPLAQAAEQLARMNERALTLRQVSDGDDDFSDVHQLLGWSEAEPETKPDPPADVRDTLLGVEGAGSAAYFRVFASLLRQDLGFHGRVRRPPTDPVNALLSYGYVLLMHQIESAINVVGLDPFIGYLHAAKYGRPALALDLMEEFRPVIVDSVVLSLINNRVLTVDSFESELGAYRLTERARRSFLEKFEERLNTPVEHPTFGYKAAYRRCLELQVRLLAKRLTGEVPEYVPFYVR